MINFFLEYEMQLYFSSALILFVVINTVKSEFIKIISFSAIYLILLMAIFLNGLVKGF